MATIKAYTTKDGSTQYYFKIYKGVNPATGKKETTTRRGFSTEKAARMAATKMQSDIDEHKNVREPSKLTFKYVAEKYWEERKLNMRESTKIDRRLAIEQYVYPSIGQMRIGYIRREDIVKAITGWKKRSEYLANDALGFTRAVFKFAIASQLAKVDPTKGLSAPIPHRKGQDEDLFWDKDQMDKFFSCIDRDTNLKDYAIFRTLAYTGLRHGELIALQWGDVDLVACAIKVTKTLSNSREVKGGKIEPPKTPAGNRVVPLDGETVKVLKDWKELQAKELIIKGWKNEGTKQYVFNGRQNKHIAKATIPYRLKKIIDDNNLKPAISIHKFRHSYISNMLISGASVSTVQHLVGHESPEITLRVYAHISKDVKTEAADAFAKYMKGDEPKTPAGKSEGRSAETAPQPSKPRKPLKTPSDQPVLEFY
ncbi:tyrosine-type recombinase/integrase [Lacticaseibacillus parakribbianus]|uniref:tyrosine-type recombinase/integrase n=1 Tax=Lacticaseibacillus parakribbianus TaxID=2970927 RepID=UPI0021CB6035|nr:tyrosine-type recombinase/integrase [Lacticaseibacillus parakribbianus]